MVMVRNVRVRRAPDDGGADILLPSHPDVIIDMDPAAGRIVVRPLTYYGE